MLSSESVSVVEEVSHFLVCHLLGLLLLLALFLVLNPGPICESQLNGYPWHFVEHFVPRPPEVFADSTSVPPWGIQSFDVSFSIRFVLRGAVVPTPAINRIEAIKDGLSSIAMTIFVK